MKIIKYNNFSNINEGKIDIHFKKYFEKHNKLEQEIFELDKEYYNDILNIIIIILDRYIDEYPDPNYIEFGKIPTINSTDYRKYSFRILYKKDEEWTIKMQEVNDDNEPIYGYDEINYRFVKISKLDTLSLYHLLQLILKNEEIIRPYTNSILKSINK